MKKLQGISFFLWSIWGLAPHGISQTLPHTEANAFIQEYSVKYYASGLGQMKKVYADRNGNIQVLADSGLLMPSRGAFFVSRDLSSRSTLPPHEGYEYPRYDPEK